MTDLAQHREALVQSMERSCGNDPQQQLNNICGYVLVVGGMGLDLKIPIYGLCNDELGVPNCTMVLVHGFGLGFYWVRHEGRNIRIGAEANLYIRHHHRRYLRAMNPDKDFRIDQGIHIPERELYLLEGYA